ncbi:MAG: aminoglycoside phosphotransferase family protein [Chthoniobacter sp.]|nr:aminoglycoside phosphotransferase family protein [Chthoniobacter sp.]
MIGSKQTHLLEISRQFQIHGEILHAEPCKVGHINETYTATYDQGGTKVRYIHQRINHDVFTDPAGVMDNLLRVTTHLRGKLAGKGTKNLTRRALTVVPTHDGRSFHKTADGQYWRTFVFIEGVRTFEAVESPTQAYQAGKAFGEFQSLLVDLPGDRLVETIPHFHNTRRRFDTLVATVSADKANRAASAKAEIEWALRQECSVDTVLSALAKKRIPERVTHNDTKFNNVMLDVASGEAMCVVDLDTVMPGSPLYDFGDMVRTTTSPTLEDELDLAKVRMTMPMFKGLARGYLEAAGGFLTKNERALIAFSGRLITYTIGLRFLTDYLQGDTYFRVHRAQHNLDRTRTQFRLVESIAKQEEAMQKFADSL